MKRFGIVATVAVLSLTSCHSNTATPSSSSASLSRSAAPSAAPAISEAAAQRVLAHYQDTNNKANAALSPTLLGTVEGGGLYAQSTAQMKQEPTWSASERALYHKPFAFTHPRFLRPAGVSWWAALTTVTGAGVRPGTKTIAVFDRDSSGAWKMVATVGIDAGQPVPDFPAVPVAAHPTTAAALSIEDSFASGGKHAGQNLISTPATKAMHDTWSSYTWNKKIWASRIDTVAPAYPKVYALGESDGGTVALVDTNFAVRNFILQPGLMITPGKRDALYIGTKKRYEVDETYLTQNLLFVPPAGTGKIRVLGTRWEMTGVHAT